VLVTCLRTAWLISLLLALSSPASALNVKVLGVDAIVARNISHFLGKPRDDSPRALKKFIESIPLNANKAMHAIGYYNAAYDVQQTGNAEKFQLTVSVVAGQAVKISKINIQIQNEAQVDPGYMPVIGRIPIRGNSVFTHADYENTKSVLINAALDRGYFDFEFTTSSVRVSREESTAEITLIADSGERYRFADVEITSDYFSPEFIRGYIPFKTGDHYEARLLATLTQQMQTTGYFDTVKVVPRRGIVHGKTVPVALDVVRKDKNYIGIGLGYDSDTRWRTKLTWSKPLVNKKGHSFESEFGLSEPQQNLSFQYRVPRRRDPLNNYWSLEYGLLNRSEENNDSFLSTFNIQRIKKNRRGWRESWFVRWERERYEISGVKDNSDLLLPGISYSKNKSVGTPFPSKGYTVSAQFTYGSRKLLSDIDLYKATFNYKWLRTFADINTLIFSLQYGAIRSNNYDRVPVSQRFFAGGGRSVRGFDYRTLSPLDEKGNPVGGRFLEVFSAEYNYRFRERWAAALFVDTGRAFNSKDEGFNVGVGTGLRWMSPVGPFRVDFAYGISDKDPDFTFHLSLGPDL